MGAASIRARPPSTVWGLLTQWYGSWLKTRRVINDFVITNTPQRVCTADPSRVILILSNLSGSGITFGENRNITFTTGIPLAPGQTVVLDWSNDLDLMTTEIWAVSPAGSFNLHVIESLLIGEFEGTADQ